MPARPEPGAPGAPDTQTPDVRRRGSTPITLHPCAGGPLLVRGPAVVTAADGTCHETTRPVSAVCRCGATGLAPWCDGTHKVLARKRRATD